MKHILIIQAHPDASTPHFCHALQSAYAEAAQAAGHRVEVIDLGKVEVKLLRSKAAWESDDQLPEFAAAGQAALARAEHVVFIYPLWLGSMPAVLKAWLEQVLRPNFAFNIAAGGQRWSAKLGGQSARVIITMGMPAFFYRLFYFSHSLRSFERNILKFCGIKPVRTSLIGMVDKKNPAQRANWLRRMARIGREGN